MLSQQQIDELQKFKKSLSASDEWMFWNICALEPIFVAGRKQVTFEREYDVMKQWKG